MMIKKILVLCTFCVLSAPIYADEDADHQSCMKAVTKGDKAENSTPEYKKFTQKYCDCLVDQVNLFRQNKNSKADSNEISKACFFTALLHSATDDLDKNTSGSDMMTA